MAKAAVWLWLNTKFDLQILMMGPYVILKASNGSVKGRLKRLHIRQTETVTALNQHLKEISKLTTTLISANLKERVELWLCSLSAPSYLVIERNVSCIM